MIATGVYVLLIVLVNWGFSVVPLWHGWPPLSLAVGLIFVARDYAQREIGHWIWAAMIGAGAPSGQASETNFRLQHAPPWAPLLG